MPYGDYQGQLITQVPARVLVRLWETQFSRTPPHKLTVVGRYIKDNLESLKKEASKEKV